MSRRARAIETVKVCLWALSSATGSSSIAGAEKAFSKVSGFTKFIPGNEPEAASRAAAALTAMLESNAEFSDHALDIANALLREKAGAIRTDAALLKTPEARRDFPSALYAHIFAKAPPQDDDRVDDLLRAVIEEAFKELRKDDTFHTVFVQEGIIGIESRLESMESRPIAAARQLDRGALTSYLDEAVDTIIAEVRALNHAGDTPRREATRTKGATAPAILARAFAAYDAALEVYTREQHAVDWAMTQHNLALAKAGWLEVEGTSDPCPHLAEALVYVELALSVLDRAQMGHSHAAAVQLRDSIRAELNTLL
ncbi:MAG: hypothetical protein AAFM92_14430 [Pseudomonadota bacterium]